MTGSAGTVTAAIAGATFAAFALAFAQSTLNRGIGSDHPVHVFLIRAIQRSGFRLFQRIPRLLNPIYCAALPLYLHWVFAHLGTRSMRVAERLLNPVVNTLQVVTFAALAWAAAQQLGLDDRFVIAATWLFALTPHFYHAMSARNFGLSARGIGLLMLTGELAAAAWIETGSREPYAWLLLAGTAYLVWAFSTFGAQALVILSLLSALLFGRWAPLAGTLAGLAIFVAVHPRYSLGYLRHTLSYIQGYAVELAPIYILRQRYSVWRDLVWDIWVKLIKQPQAGVRYAYGNPVLIVLALNPLLIAAIAAWAVGALPRGGIVGFATDIALCGAAASFLTSFRPTRFLGEPERYVEAASPWIALAGAAMLASSGLGTMIALGVVFLAMDLMQLGLSLMLRRHITGKPIDLSAARMAIEGAVPGPIRFTGNNEQLTKLMLGADWSFVYCMALERNHCGMPLSEAFSSYPFLQRPACERIVTHYRINACLLDRTTYDTLFDVPPPGLRAMRVIHETAGVRVLALDWDPATATAAA